MHVINDAINDAALQFTPDGAIEEIVKDVCSWTCRFVAVSYAAFDRVDVRTCALRGIVVVACVPNHSLHSVAEHAVAMLLCLIRQAHLHTLTLYGSTGTCA